MNGCVASLAVLLLLHQSAGHNHHHGESHAPDVAVDTVVPSVGGERVERWVPYGDPYQERVVSLLPGSDLPQAQSPFVYPAPQPQYFPPAPPQPQQTAYAGPPIIVPVVTNQETQEQKSKDLDVGVYTGMDIPWTHIPPFSTTYKAGLGAQTPPPLQPQQAPAPAYPNFYYNGPPAAPAPQMLLPPPPPPRPIWSDGREVGVMYPRVPQNPYAPYPYLMRQQGGFAVKRDEDDVKLTMHVPKDGPPGGVLVMEMKANVYRPVY